MLKDGLIQKALHSTTNCFSCCNGVKIAALSSAKRQRHFDTANIKTDIIYMKTKNGYTIDSDFVHTDFIKKNPGISIPYLILMSISTITGCIGNTLVIGSVLSYKV